MHQKWHIAYEEATHIPFVVSSPLLPGGRRGANIPTSHADLLPTLLGLAGIDQAEARKRVAADHKEAHPLVGRDLSGLIRGTGTAASEPVLFMTDDEISEGSEVAHSPFQIWAKKLGTFEHIVQPNHIEMVVAEVEVDGAQHLVKLVRYHDNPQYWTVPGERDERLMRRKKILNVTERTPDEYELYDLTLDPMEQHNLAHPTNADDRSRALLTRMRKILIEQLAAKRLAPASGGLPGYSPPEKV
jgi:arylsulfatase A-like enzyme